jgi:transposase
VNYPGYGYCGGKASSRKLQQGTYENRAVRYLAADEHPDYDTIAEFQRRHPGALGRVFAQVVRTCAEADWCGWGMWP